jgi:hypothetical protein
MGAPAALRNQTKYLKSYAHSYNWFYFLNPLHIVPLPVKLGPMIGVLVRYCPNYTGKCSIGTKIYI